MLFANENLADEQLPKLQSIVLKPVSPLYARLRLASQLLQLLLLLLALAGLKLQPFWSLPTWLEAWYGLGTLLLILFCSLLFAYRFVANRRLGYGLRSHDISLGAGWWWRSLTTQPLLRVQHIELTRGPIERHFGLASLQVYSAGGELFSLVIPGLPQARAQQLRQYILEYKEQPPERDLPHD